MTRLEYLVSALGLRIVGWPFARCPHGHRRVVPAAAIRDGRFDLVPYKAFVARHLGASDGRAGDRLVDRFLPR